jgi:hypothetical protein
MGGPVAGNGFIRQVVSRLEQSGSGPYQSSSKPNYSDPIQSQGREESR